MPRSDATRYLLIGEDSSSVRVHKATLGHDMKRKLAVDLLRRTILGLRLYQPSQFFLSCGHVTASAPISMLPQPVLASERHNAVPP